MADAEKYAQWIVANKEKKGTTEFETVANAYKQAKSESQPVSQEKSFFSNLSIKNIPQNAANLAGGLVRGAGSIGATILAPADMINQKLRGEDFFSLKDNNERRQKIDDGLQMMGADPNSTGYKGGKLISEIAGTGDVGGVLGLGVDALKIQKAQKLANALKSGGFSLGSQGGNAAINGATRVAGGAGTGGAAALAVNPQDVGTGAAIGASVPIAGKLIGGAGGVIGDAIRPFTAQGKNEILSDFLKNQAGQDNVPQVIHSLESARGNTAGFNPTTGQAANNPNLATLERTYKARNPNAFQDTELAQRGALADSIRGMGGDDLARQGLINNRESAVSDLYDQAKQTNLPIDNTLSELLKRPAIAQAQNEATTNALNRGSTITPITPSDSTALSTELGNNNQYVNGKTLHEVKMALDAAKNHTAMGGANQAQLGAIGDASKDFNSYLDNAIPAYAQAKNTFSELSKPINQMDLGNAIADKFIPASQRDVPVPMQLNREQLAKALYDNGDKLAQSVTGFKGATLENTLNPNQLQAFKNAVKDSQYIKQGEQAGKGVGSDTMQKLAFNSQLNSSGLAAKLLNIPAVGATASAIKGIAGLAYGGANKALEQKLANVLLNPKQAAELLKMNPQEKNRILANLLQNQSLGNAAAVSSAQ